MRGLSSWKLVSLLALTLFSSGLALNAPRVLSQGAPSGTESQPGLSNAELQKKAQRLVESLGRGEYQRVIDAMSPELRAYWTAEKIREVWERRVTGVVGPYKKVLRSNVIDVVNAKLVVVNTQFEKSNDDVVVTFNSQGLPVGVDFPDKRNVEEISTAFINHLARKNYALARSLLSPLLKAEALPARVQSGWESLLERTGPFQKIVSVEVKPGADNDNITLAIAKVQFANTTRDIFLIFDDQKQITNVDYAQ